jgi:hypothetical protein
VPFQLSGKIPEIIEYDLTAQNAPFKATTNNFSFL